MTAITLNLLAEEQFAKRALGRDPVKIALAIGISLIAIAVTAGVLLGHSAEKMTHEADSLQAKWDALQSGQGSGGTTDTKSLKTVADEIVSLNRSRRLFAPQLALLKDRVPSTVELKRLGFSTSIETKAPPPMDASSSGGADDLKQQRKSQPKSSDRLVLMIEGQATGVRPEVEVDQFIKEMRTDSALSVLLEDVTLRSIALGQGAAKQPSVVFVIECSYKEGK